MDYEDIERRRLVCVEAASRIISENLSTFMVEKPDPTLNKLHVAKAVRDVAQLLYREISKID